MADITQILYIILIIIFTIDAILALAYTLSIIFVRQFHTASNILLGNVSFISFITACYFIFFTIEFYSPTPWYTNKSFCIILSHCSLALNFLVVYSFVTITINRYLLIVHSNKLIFKRRAWAFATLAIHWLVSISLGMSKLSAALRVNIKLKAIQI